MMTRGDYVLAAILMFVVICGAIWFQSLIQAPMHYTWTTPPDQYCNVWEH